MKKFKHGQLVMTQGVASLFEEDGVMKFVHESIGRHLAGDWGELCDEDKAENEYSLKHGLRLLSAYSINGTKIWIITEADRSVTTVLLPEEY